MSEAGGLGGHSPLEAVGYLVHKSYVMQDSNVFDEVFKRG